MKIFILPIILFLMIFSSSQTFAIKQNPGYKKVDPDVMVDKVLTLLGALFGKQDKQDKGVQQKASVHTSQGSGVTGSVESKACSLGNGNSSAPTATTGLGSTLANVSDANLQDSTKKEIAALTKKYNASQSQQNEGLNSQKQILLRMRYLLNEEIKEKKASVALHNLAETTSVADAVEKLKSMQVCRDAVTEEHNIMIKLYNSQLNLYTGAGSYKAEEEIEKEDGFIKSNKAFAIIENPKSSWEEIDKTMNEVEPVLEKMGKSVEKDKLTANDIPYIVRSKWPCASGLRIGMGLLDRPFTEGGKESVDQALTRYEKHGKFVDSVLKHCKAMNQHGLAGVPEKVEKECAAYIKNEQNVIEACPSVGNSKNAETKPVSEDPIQMVDNQHTQTTSSIASGQYSANNQNKTMPEDRAAQIAARKKVLEESIKVSEDTIKKIEEEIKKIEQVQKETKGLVSYLIDSMVDKIKIGLQSIISVSYAKEKRILPLTQNGNPMGCIFRSSSKDKCSSFATLWQNQGPGKKILGNQLDKSIQASINLGDLMQGHTQLDEKGFQYMDELIKENSNVENTRIALVAQLDDLYKKEGYVNVTHAKKTESVLSKWQKITQDVLASMGQKVSFDTSYSDPFEGKDLQKNNPTISGPSEETNAIESETSSQQVPVTKAKSSGGKYEEMKDVEGDDINVDREKSIFETISKKYLKKFFE